MATGQLTASLPVYVDFNDNVAIKAAVDALILTAITDRVFIIPAGNGKQVSIFKVEVEA